MTNSAFPRLLLAVATAASVITLAACADRGITDPGVRAAATSPASLSFGKTLIECPTSTTTTASGLITPLGGVITAGGTSITVPAGAVLLPTTIEVVVPASNYMEVDISVPGMEHFVFQQPVTISVSYARCTRNNINSSALSAWYIDSATKALLEDMGGMDDKVARTVTFTTPHLSGYALAN